MHGGFYEGRVFRPPSEAYSLIIQSTIGCSHNGCEFCSMYKEKRFRIRSVESVKDDLAMARRAYARIPRIFLADGDALIRKTAEQLEILGYIKEIIPECERVTSYASPKSVLVKSVDELCALHSAGLEMVYMGLESGDDAVLARMNKGATAAELIAAAQRVHEGGIKLSVTAINGLGGAEGLREHATKTGEALTRMKPEYIGLLTLMCEPEAPLTADIAHGRFILPSQEELLHETALMIEHTNSEGSVFRANHASNYLELRGTLNADKSMLLDRIDRALSGGVQLKDERFRGL